MPSGVNNLPKGVSHTLLETNADGAEVWQVVDLRDGTVIRYTFAKQKYEIPEVLDELIDMAYKRRGALSSGTEIDGIEITDPWFLKYHAFTLRATPGFAAWWLNYYGSPEPYERNDDAQHEYYVRMAFALRGWQAARE